MGLEYECLYDKGRVPTQFVKLSNLSLLKSTRKTMLQPTSSYAVFCAVIASVCFVSPLAAQDTDEKEPITQSPSDITPPVATDTEPPAPPAGEGDSVLQSAPTQVDAIAPATTCCEAAPVVVGCVTPSAPCVQTAPICVAPQPACCTTRGGFFSRIRNAFRCR